MNPNIKRIAILTAMMLVPSVALAAAVASGADGGMAGDLFASFFSCSSGCPNSP